MGHSIDKTRRDHISKENMHQTLYLLKGQKRSSHSMNMCQTDHHTCTIGVMGALNITHPNDLPPKSYTIWLITSHIQIFWPPYHKSIRWRFRWLWHVIQVYQTGILHHRSATEKVTAMHLTKWMSSWWCYCSARPTHCFIAMKPGFIPFIGSHDDVTGSLILLRKPWMVMKAI